MMLTMFRPISQKVLKRTIRRSVMCRCLSVGQAKGTGVTWEEVRIPVPWGHVAGKFWGDKSQPPVLALHGWQDNANSFDPLIPLLNLPSVLAIDLPGHGFSSHFPEGRNYHFEEFLMLIPRILQHYNLNKIGFLSHSLGGTIAFIYAALFPDQVKWVINYECARSLLSLYRYDTPQSYSQAIDMSLKTENQKKVNKIPAYKLSQMVLMSIKGSLGSVVSPESAMILLQRGVKEVDDLSAAKLEDKPANESDLKNLADIDANRLKGMLAGDKEKFNEMMFHIKKTLDDAKESVAKYFADKKDEKYYIFLRDPMLKIQSYQSLHSDLVMEASKNITCPFLSMRTINGFLHGGSKDSYEKSLELIKASSSYMEHHEVEGTHHGKWWGSTDQRPVLCVHGWLDNANSFDNLIPLLPSEMSYLAIDLPGEGFSSHLPRGFMYKHVDSVATLRRVQKYFNWSKVSLIGHSYGAQCVFLFSSMFSKDVDFCVALDALKPFTFNPSKRFQKESKNVQKFFEYESFSDEQSPLYSKEELINRLLKGTKDSLTKKSCEVLIERGTENVNGLHKLLRDIRVKVNTEFHFSQREHLKFAESVTCDVLYIKAKDYDYFEKKEYILNAMELMKKSARTFEYHVLPGTHHFHLNNPEDIAPVIVTFIKRVRNSQESKSN